MKNLIASAAAGIALGFVAWASGLGIIPIWDGPHFHGVIVGTETHAIYAGWTPQVGWVAGPAALER